MKKKQPKWKMIAKGDRLPCWSFIRKMDGTVLPLTTIGGAFSGQDAYYLPVKDVIEIIKDFPKEESEGERICGQLIAFLKQSKAVYSDGFKQFGLDIDDALAWLEKQSMQKQELLTKEKALKNSPFVEQKPAESIWHEMTENPEGDENDRTLVVFEDGHSTTSNALLHIGFGTSKPYKWAYVNDILRLTSNTKQSEQEPVVPKFKVGDVIKDTENGEVLTIRAITKDKYIYTDDSFDWIKDQDVYELVEQKPAWSEEDEEIHRRCICAMRASACGFPEEEKFVEQVDNWLESLKGRVQLQQKQEWSEDDEENLWYVIAHLEKVVDKGHYNYLYDWLKSLRPQSTWKPSDEQMEALNTCIMQGEISYVGQGTELQYLYNDLKKLTE